MWEPAWIAARLFTDCPTINGGAIHDPLAPVGKDADRRLKEGDVCTWLHDFMPSTVGHPHPADASDVRLW